MIISHRHRFIFMHGRKTAGSTITALCNPYMGPEDIQVGAWPDAIAAGGAYNRWALRIALRYSFSLLGRSALYSIRHKRLALSHTVNSLVKTHMRENAGFEAGAHATAAQVRDFDEDAWNNYFKFCFVRNPWDHAVSDFYWRTNSPGRRNLGFKEFLRRLNDPALADPENVRPPITTNWEVYTIDDQIAVDFIGRYENLQDELARVGEKLGFPLDLSSAPRAKGSVRDRSKSIRSHYDDECVELVARIYADEIAQFGYEPDFD